MRAEEQGHRRAQPRTICSSEVQSLAVGGLPGNTYLILLAVPDKPESYCSRFQIQGNVFSSLGFLSSLSTFLYKTKRKDSLTAIIR